ncbi:MAG: hypothetical protein NE330_02325 [Lentisphaeraceae bacterium]|nr:hypothetical protein [Lentisphaeraceae bacterium]
MINYDFILSRDDANSLIDKTCIIRRYSAAIIDTIVILLILILLAIPGESDIAGLYNFALLVAITVLPEYFYRQSFGMFICDVVVLVPPKEDPKKVLVIRKLVNIVEFVLPSFIYYFFVACTKNNKSISDEASGCMIVRKKYLVSESKPPKRELNQFEKIVLPLLFSTLPFIIFVVSPILTFYILSESDDLFVTVLKIIAYLFGEETS